MEKRVEKISLKIPNKHGDNLTADLRFPVEFESEESLAREKENLPLIVFCHGFKGFKDWGSFPYVFDKLALEGAFVTSFNFSYNGIGEESPDEFTRLDLFAENTFSRELDDLGSVIDWLEDNQDKYSYDFSTLILIGHSRGGGIAILKAAEDKRVKKLITLASVSNFDRYSPEHKKRWKEKGYFEVQNARTKQMMRLNYSLLQDLEDNKERLDIQANTKNINVPFLIIHGKEDLAVDYSNAESIYSQSNKENTKLILMENAGHTFGAVHPFTASTKALENIIKYIVQFI